MKWYHTYLLHSVMDQMYVMIFQHLYWSESKGEDQKEFRNCDTCHHTKGSTKTGCKLPSKLAEEITWNKLCVRLISPYEIRKRDDNLDLLLKSVTMFDTVTGSLK